MSEHTEAVGPVDEHEHDALERLGQVYHWVKRGLYNIERFVEYPSRLHPGAVRISFYLVPDMPDVSHTPDVGPEATE